LHFPKEEEMQEKEKEKWKSEKGEKEKTPILLFLLGPLGKGISKRKTQPID